MNTQAKKYVLDFLKSQKIGVVSTVLGAQPQSANVYYTTDESLNIYFITPVNCRKYFNIQSNNKVSFVVGTENPPQTVQVDGTAEVVTDQNTINTVTANYYAALVKNNQPIPVTKLDVTGGLVVYKITPRWMRWSDFTDMIKKGGYGVTEVIIDIK